MDDVDTVDTSPQPGAETPAGDVPTETETELELEPEAVGDDQAEGEDELEDWEEEGKTYKVPKPLKAHLLRNKDYTSKTQEVAAQRKEIEAERERVAEEAKFHRENVREVAKLVSIDERLEAFRKLTAEQWSELWSKNAQEAGKLQGEFNMLKDQRERALGELQQKQQQALEKQRASHAKQYEDGLARIAKKIPGWSDDLAGKLNAYASENGFSLEELQGFIPRKNAEAYVSVLHKAHLYDQLVAKQRAKARQETAEPAPVPVPKVSARRPAPSSEPLDSDPPEVWLRKRNKQLGIGAR